jgi:3-polyprenyl-4-hydroxybenzoate decarboxylase
MQDNDIDGSGKAASAVVTAPQTVADVLDAAATRLEQHNAWTKDAYARRADGSATQTTADDAVCWCTVGAIASIAGGFMTPLFDRAVGILGLSLGRTIVGFNDAPNRQQEEVVAALRAAATSARQGETK